MRVRPTRWMVVVGMLVGAGLGLAVYPGPIVAEAAAPIRAAASTPVEPQYVPGRYIVVFKDTVARPQDEAARFDRRFANQGLGLGPVYTGGLRGFAAFIPDSILPVIKNDPAVKYIERDQLASLDQSIKPDLLITGLTASPTDATTGQSISVSVTVKNTSTVPVGQFYISIYYDLATTPTPITPKSASKRVDGGLTAGASATLTFGFSYSTAGVKGLRALADSYGAISEANENNNAAGPVDVSVINPQASPKPDFLITGFTASPTSVQTGQSVSVSVTVKNTSGVASGPFYMSIYADLAGLPTIATTKSASKKVDGGLAGGASATLTFSVSYSTSGTKSLRALADSYGAIDESNETNNPAGPVSITVGSSAPPSSTQEIPTGIRRIGADLSSAKAGDGSGEVIVTVAVLDTGIDANHTELNVVYSAGFGYATGNDDHGHGTHVAGTIAARDNAAGVVGVASGARLWSLKVLGSDGKGYYSNIIAALNFVRDNASGVQVANVSLGGGFSQSLNDAVKQAVNAGVVVCVAAGNNGGTASSYSPASEPSALTIAALVDIDGKAGSAGGNSSSGPDDSFAAFSNYGSVVDFIAPGVSIKSTAKGGGYQLRTGTSMATPHVAGVAALYRAKNPNASADQVRAAMLNAAAEQIPGKYDSRTYPLINAKPF